jgi:FlaA1/EpsC-like NDP-sugar epimerase
MPRFLTRGLQVVIDMTILSIAYWCGFLFRFEFSLPHYWLIAALTTWGFVVAFEYFVLHAYRVPRFSWRYVSLRETERIFASLGTSTAVLVAMRFALDNVSGVLQHGVVPLGVLGTNFFLACVGLVGARATRRLYGEAKERTGREQGVVAERERVLLIGAGRAGVLVAQELAARPDLGFKAVGFVDDDPLKTGTQICGVAVLGTTHELKQIADLKHVARVLITIANTSGEQLRRIVLQCREAGLDTRIIPAMSDIVGEQVNLSRIRKIAIEDLLGREPVQLDAREVSDSIRGEVVMVTGAGGSIGSELCRQLCRYAPARLLLVERFENALFEIHRELIKTFPDLTVEPWIADVTDRARMSEIFGARRPSFVFLAAAHKHVPMMEENAGEALKNNVGGSRLLADLADRHGVGRFVLVSTDKAVNPTSVMGATKRVAEIYTQALGQRSKTRFVTVRFGNVLGSNGSVIPIFKEQIAAGGPVTVTHPDMERYFMTIAEASQLVLQAGVMGQGGEIFILDMGKRVRILDLARDLITLSGLTPDRDIKIEFSGIRPAEKLFEELATDGERADKTKHPKIFIGRIPPRDWTEATRSIEELLGHVSSDAIRIRQALLAVVPEYTGANASTAPVTDDTHDVARPRRAESTGDAVAAVQ